MNNKKFSYTHLFFALFGGIFVGGSTKYVNNITNLAGSLKPSSIQEVPSQDVPSQDMSSLDMPSLDYVSGSPCALTTSALHSYAIAFDSKVPDAAIALSERSTFDTYSVDNVYTKPLKELCHDGFYIEYKTNADTELTCHTNFLSSVGTISITLPKDQTAAGKLEHRVFVSGYGFSHDEGSVGTTSVPNAFEDDPVVLVGVELPIDTQVSFQDTIAETDLANLINLDTVVLSEKLKKELDIDSTDKIYRSRASTWM